MIPLVGIEHTTVYSQTVCMVRYILYIYLLFLMVKFNAKDHFVSGNKCVGVTEQQNTQKKPFWRHTSMKVSKKYIYLNI